MKRRGENAIIQLDDSQIEKICGGVDKEMDIYTLIYGKPAHPKPPVFYDNTEGGYFLTRS